VFGARPVEAREPEIEAEHSVPDLPEVIIPPVADEPFDEETMMNRPLRDTAAGIGATTPSPRRATWRASVEATRFTGVWAR